MILPTKHISTSRSLIGLGAVLLPELGADRTPTQLWERARGSGAFQNHKEFVLTLDLLHALGLVEMREGLLGRTQE